MFQQLPMYQQVGDKAYKVDLTHIKELCAYLGNPQATLKAVHVAGTNGKGSVSHMLASVLQENGYRTGLYTSPHLKDFRERIRINGKEISEQAVVDFIAAHRNFLEMHQYSFFELTVAMAFQYFVAEEVDIAVIEVGLGGRLDSTNIISPEVSVITNIGLDHTNFLGTTLEAIAGEKGGIIKRATPVIIGEYQAETYPVFQKIAEDKQAPLFLAEDDTSVLPATDLRGHYQEKNVRTSITALQVLKDAGWAISTDSVAKGIGQVVTNTGLRGRWEVLREVPRVICDTAHNREGLVYAMKQLQEERHQRLLLVIGMVREKDLESVLPVFPREARYFFCRPDIPRGLDAGVLRDSAGQKGLKGKAYASVSEAYAEALKEATPEDVVYVGGSTFTVAEII